MSEVGFRRELANTRAYNKHSKEAARVTTA
jgi:hypothetical protein